MTTFGPLYVPAPLREAVSDVVVRRSVRLTFQPPAETPDELPTVSRTWAARTIAAAPKLPRERKMAGDLPSWSPAPPGSVPVRRA